MKPAFKCTKIQLFVLFFLFLFQSRLFAQSTTYQIIGYCYAYPYQIGQVDTPGNAYDLAIQGNYAYVADGTTGLRVIDISNPSSPHEISYVLPQSSSSNFLRIVINNNYAYLAAGNGGLRIINIGNPFNPVEVGYSSASAYVYGIAVSGDYAFLTGFGGLYIFNISNSNNPIKVGNFATPSNPAFIAIRENYAYVSLLGTSQGTDCSFSYANTGFQVIDISHPSHPISVQIYGSTSPGSDLTIDGNNLYFIESGGVIWSGDEWCSPILGCYCFNIYYSYFPFALHAYDISTPTVLQGMGSIHYDGIYGQTGTMAVSGKYSYTGLGSNGLHIIDMTNYSQIAEIANINTSAFNNVKLSGKYAYLSAGNSGFLVINVKEPIKNATLTLTGDTLLVTSTDNTGYYQFPNISYGYYSTSLSDYTSSPNYRIYSPLTTNRSEQNFLLTVELTIPTTPANLIAQPISDTQIQLTWRDYANTENGFGIDVKVGNGNWQVLTFVSSNVTTFTHSGLITGQKYGYRIYSYNNLGLSGYSNEAYAIPGSPKAPANLSAELTPDTQVRLTWKDNANYESGYGIDYRVNYGSWNILDWVGSNVTTYLHSNLIAGQTYSYRVYGWNNNGLSNYSNEASITLPIPPTEIRKEDWLIFQ